MARLSRGASGNSPPVSLDPVPGPYSFACPELGLFLWAPLALMGGREVIEGLKAQADCPITCDSQSRWPFHLQRSGFLGRRAWAPVEAAHLPLLYIWDKSEISLPV